jgi:DNA polymerase-3 subunit delta'
LAKQIPQMNRQSIQTLADSCAGKNAAERYEITLRLFMLFISRLAKFGALQKNENHTALSIESKVFHELAPDTKSARKWADFSQIISERTSHARAVNLDPSMVILDMLLQFEETSKKH